MAPNLTAFLLSGSRGKVLLVITLFFLLTLLISFRGVVTDAGAWASSADAISNNNDQAEIAPSPTSLVTKIADAAPIKRPTRTSTVSVEATTTTSAKSASKPTSSKSKAPKPAAGSSSSKGTESKGSEAKVTYDCNNFPDTSDILLVMKTGATEAYDKLPIHFLTTLRCVNDSIIFSDMEMEMAGYRLRDVLADIDDEVKKDNDDFSLYATLQEYRRLHEDPRPLKDGMNGWNLDKYKFVPMMTKTWEYRKDASWYFFVEADTGVNWDNLRTFLDTLDHTKPYYIGSPTYLDIEFAHGGTGYAISHAAMELAVGKHNDLNEKYNGLVQPICCGDRMIARILLDEQIKLTKAWPMFNGEKPLTLPFGENQWCQPVITMHHMTAQEVSQVWVFDQKRKAKGSKDPLIWKDVFDYFVKDNIAHTTEREDWENLSGDMIYTPDPERDFSGRKWEELSEIERQSPESPEKCKAMCEHDTSCFQWMHHGKDCAINHSIRLGGSRQPQNNERWVSGWQAERIAQFREKMEDCKGGFDWRTSGP